MTIVKIAICASILLFGLILYAVFVPSPTIAGECTSYDATAAKMISQGGHLETIPADKLGAEVAKAR